MPFAEGAHVIKLLHGLDMRSASGPYQVESVTDGVVRLVDSALEYDDRTGRELDPSVPGFHTEIVDYEGPPG